MSQTEAPERIFATADELYEKSGRLKFPTVDEVRIAASAGMGPTVRAMREWRRSQNAKTAPVPVVVPEAVQAAGVQAIAALWQQAQELANESLKGARVAWEAERAEQDRMSDELAQAFEAQAIEVRRMQAALVEAEQGKVDADAALVEKDRQLVDALSGLRLADMKAAEADRRAAELRMELDRAHSDMDRGTAEVAALRSAQAGFTQQIESLKGELAQTSLRASLEAETHATQRKASAQEISRQAERYVRLEAQRDEARKEAATAQNAAAELRGKVEGLQMKLTQTNR